MHRNLFLSFQHFFESALCIVAIYMKGNACILSLPSSIALFSHYNLIVLSMLLFTALCEFSLSRPEVVL